MPESKGRVVFSNGVCSAGPLSALDPDRRGLLPQDRGRLGVMKVAHLFHLAEWLRLPDDGSRRILKAAACHSPVQADRVAEPMRVCPGGSAARREPRPDARLPRAGCAACASRMSRKLTRLSGDSAICSLVVSIDGTPCSLPYRPRTASLSEGAEVVGAPRTRCDRDVRPC